MFKPLHYTDGSPCYFRATCLSLFALSLLLHVGLKAIETEQAASAAQGASLLSANEVNVNVATQAPVVTNSSEPVVVATVAPISVNKATHEPTLEQALTQMQEQYQRTESSSSAWSLFDDSEDKLAKSLLKNRKLALGELVDGAAFFNSCGSINESYESCKFSFSSKVTGNYEPKIEALQRNFVISLTAKGEQLRDNCAKFVVTSDGMYLAFNRLGQEDRQCFLDPSLNEQAVAISKSIQMLKSRNSAASRLASN